METDPLYWALMLLITCLSAFPAVFFSIYVLMKSETVKRMLADQIRALPTTLSDPQTRYAFKQAIEGIMPEVRTGMTASISQGVREQLEQQLLATVNNKLDQAGEKLTASLKGALGAYTKNLAAQMTPGEDGQPMREGPLAGIAPLLSMLRGMKSGNLRESLAPSETSMHM